MRKLSLGSRQSPAHLLERGRAAHRLPLPLAASILALWLPAVNSDIEFIPRGLGKSLASKECVPSRGLAEMFMEFQNLLKWLENPAAFSYFLAWAISDRLQHIGFAGGWSHALSPWVWGRILSSSKGVV